MSKRSPFRKNQRSQRKPPMRAPSRVTSSLALPSLRAPPRSKFCIRYQLNLSGSSLYTGSLTCDVIASLLVIATVNGAGTPQAMLPYLDSVRLHRVRLYACDTTATTGNTVTVTGSFPSVPVSSLVYGSKLVQSSSSIIGSAGFAIVDLKPSPGSPQAAYIAGQSSSTIFFVYEVNTGNATTSVNLICDITISGQPPSGYGLSSSPITFPFNASPGATINKGQLYAIPPFASLSSLSSTSAGVSCNYAPMI